MEVLAISVCCSATFPRGQKDARGEVMGLHHRVAARSRVTLPRAIPPMVLLESSIVAALVAALAKVEIGKQDSEVPEGFEEELVEKSPTTLDYIWGIYTCGTEEDNTEMFNGCCAFG
ncbi:hypothetical protein B296_00026840 [Ensete ventricosum]|uniref:Uncharacterized protein n=1 Tax=Ensete ventricosum TaxID=4639 RepID=A0A426ZEZ9_ENSVE|nr:hypothetical protein B296_00026840 [Ensete ventricosum]